MQNEHLSALKLQQLLLLPRRVKQSIVIALDIVLSLAATWIAFTLRLDIPHWPSGVQWVVYPMAAALAVPLFIRFGLYRAIFRYTGAAALAATTKAVVVYGAVFLCVLLVARWPMVPRSLGVLQPLIFLLLVGASRAIARFWLLERTARAQSEIRGRLLIYGAGAAGVQTAAGLSGRQFELAGFIDDDPTKVGRSINRLPVIAPAQVLQMVHHHGVTDILLALPSATRQRRNEIIETLRHLPVHVRTLPGLADLASGRVTVQDFQELDIEDLLGRDAVAPDATLLGSQIAGKTVLVTGAGGSIGSELCRQIMRAAPERLVLVDHSEYNLYAIHQELQARAPSGPAVLPRLASVTQAQRMHDLFAEFRPHTVYHAAAYKHVPLVEQNPAEGILNNVFGTLVTAQAAQAHCVDRFVLVSTDKAVRPTNVMGASKRVAELVLQALARPVVSLNGTTHPTVFGMVRFGNVLGSSGSVVPLFRRQLAAGGPLTVTHPDVTRYFMTIPEAAQLVLQAGAMAEGGEVFVLDMGHPVRIMDLARLMVRLSGLTVRDEAEPAGDIEIAVTGLRPGEKLYEELLIGDDPQPTSHPRIMKAREGGLEWHELSPALDALLAAARANDVLTMAELLRRLVSGYQPADNGDRQV